MQIFLLILGTLNCIAALVGVLVGDYSQGTFNLLIGFMCLYLSDKEKI